MIPPVPSHQLWKMLKLSPVRELQTLTSQPVGRNILGRKSLHTMYAIQLQVKLGKEQFSLAE